MATRRDAGSELDFAVDLINRVVDGVDGIRIGVEKHHQLIEGAAGAAIAGFMKQKDKLNGQRVVIVMCGGNISSEVLKSIL